MRSIIRAASTREQNGVHGLTSCALASESWVYEHRARIAASGLLPLKPSIHGHGCILTAMQPPCFPPSLNLVRTSRLPSRPDASITLSPTQSFSVRHASQQAETAQPTPQRGIKREATPCALYTLTVAYACAEAELQLRVLRLAPENTADLTVLTICTAGTCGHISAPFSQKKQRNRAMTALLNHALSRTSFQLKPLTLQMYVSVISPILTPSFKNPSERTPYSCTAAARTSGR